jgi:hypothetical protein
MAQDARQAGAIEITDAMIEAGMDALYEFEAEEFGPAKTVTKIYEAMVSSKHCQNISDRSVAVFK